ncbi:HEAT repeat domain-containing protein [Mucilaginibacter litoreus]|uniref:HEAT repeat domain-containing protein n=1 Tax=Mucilaginibacter litoreus TaxID=1048221 RepID=A0ABW3APS9_9SPHI
MKADLELTYLRLLKKPKKSKEEIEEQEQLRHMLTEELQKELKQLSVELEQAECKYTDPWDLVNTSEPYPEVIDILIKHLSKNYHKRNKEGIVRALTVKEAKGKANAALIHEYNKTSKNKDNLSLRWALGNAIYNIVTKNDIASIIDIVKNKANGESRERFVLALGKIKLAESETTLIELLDDSEMIVPALQALVILKSQKAKTKISLLTNNSNALLKKEASKALKKIEIK